MTRGLVFVLVCGAFGFGLLAGCKKVATTPVANNPAPGNPAGPGPGKAVSEPDIDPNDKFAAAKTTFRTQCARCHSTSPPGEGGKMRRGGGPNLAKVAADPKHTKAWISEHIRDPQAHNEMSKMPKFDSGKMKDADLKTLVDYLASLK